MISGMASSKRSSFVVRLDPDLHQKLKSWSDESGISLNTLAVSLLQWAVDRGHAGEPTVDEQTNFVESAPKYGVAWVGDEAEDIKDEWSGKVVDVDPGRIYFVIDDRPQSRIRTPHEYGGGQ